MFKLLLIFISAIYSNYSLAENTLADGPSSSIATSFEIEKNNNKKTHKFKLQWEQFDGAETYKVIITRKDKHFRKIYHTAKNQFTYDFIPNSAYAWKVVARKKGLDITKFSPFYDIKIINKNYTNPDEEVKTKINTISWEKETYQETSGLPKGPQTKIPKEFIFTEKHHLYPVHLKWKANDEANLYEIEIIRVSSRRRMFYFSKKNEFPIEVSPNVDYKWRVIAYQDKKKLTNYSSSYSLKVIYDPSSQDLELQALEEQNLKLKELDIIEEKYFNEIKAQELLRDKKEREKAFKQNPNNNSLEQEKYDDLLANIDKLQKQMAQQKEHYEKKIKDLNDKLKQSGQKTYELAHWNKSWARAGLGLRFTRYDQDINSNTNAAIEVNRLFHATNGDTSFNLSGGHFIKPNIAIEAQLIYSTGSFLEVTDKIFIDYSWMEFHLEGIYTLDPNGYKTKKDHWFARAGILYQGLSLLAAFPAPSTVYEVVDNNHIFISGGGGYNKMLSQNFKFQTYANLLFHIVGTTSKFSYSPEFGFGINANSRLEYLLSESFQLGLDWQLQFIELSYNLSNGNQKVDGRQNLIQNKFGLYLNYNF